MAPSSHTKLRPKTVAWTAALGETVADFARSRLSSLRARFERFHSNEDGAAYSLSYVMVIPIYVMVICLIVECTIMLVVKTGTVYAAFAAARTAIVQLPANAGDEGYRLAVYAGRRAFVPFASGLQPSSAGPPSVKAIKYWKAYREYSTSPAAKGYMDRKYIYAVSNLDVDLGLPRGQKPRNWTDDVNVTVTYRYPFTFPYIGWLIGDGVDSRGRFSMITSVASLQVEAPKDNRKSMGIGYGSP